VQRFIARHASNILGVLSGFDRLVLRGTLRNIAFVAGMEVFLSMRRVLLKDFGPFVEKATGLLKASSLREAERRGRPVLYQPSSPLSVLPLTNSPKWLEIFDSRQEANG
jgi:hypothetical protein